MSTRPIDIQPQRLTCSYCPQIHRMSLVVPGHVALVMEHANSGDLASYLTAFAQQHVRASSSTFAQLLRLTC